jgi:hypothetical protein
VVVKHLNAVVARRYDTPKLFEHGGADKYFHDETRFRCICEAIDEGLPVMLCWTTRDLGNHCVLVYGYTLGQKRWLHVKDPGGGGDVCWDTLIELSSEAIEFIVPQSTFFKGSRPDKVWYQTGPDNELRERQVLRYWPSEKHEGECRYQPLQALFERSVAKAQRSVA